MALHELGRYIKSLRTTQRLSQEELAGRLFVTRQAVSNWETGKTQPDIETLTAMGQIFGVSLDELAHGPKTDGFAEGRSKRIKLAMLLTVCWISLHLLLVLVLAPRYTAPYDPKPWEILLMLCFALPYDALATFAAGAVVHIWVNFRISDRRARTAILALGICLMAFVFIVRLVLVYTSIRLPNFLIIYVVERGTIWYYLGGALSFLGTRK
jgi:Predicted transcriptional regulators